MAEADFELEEEPFRTEPYLFKTEYSEEELHANERLWEADKQQSSQQ